MKLSIQNKILTVFLFSLLVQIATGQDNDTSVLLVGDKAPALKYSRWLKGEIVHSFDKDKIYVLEFWATWCGPCIAAMPHLSELARQYKGKVVFVGVNVWEKIVDKPYETALPSVTKFVTSMGNKIDYAVAVDNNDRFMAKGWLERAKAPGIPTTFVIKEGQIVWMGHPKSLDTLLPSVEAGKLNVAAYRKAHIESVAINKKSAAAEQELLAPIEGAIKEKQFDKAFTLMDSAVVKQPLLKYTLNIRRFKIMLEQVGEKTALHFADEWQKKEGARSGIYFAQTITENEGLSKDTYLYAANVFKPQADASGHPMMYDLMAKCYAMADDNDNAVGAEEKAIEAAKASLKSGKYVGIIHDYTVTEYERTLVKYKLKVASKSTD